MSDFGYYTGGASRVDNSGSVTVTSGATANTFGGWTQLVASTTSESSLVIIGFRSSDNVTSGLLSIGIGASGSETVIIPNIFVSGSGYSQEAFFNLPITIPKGSRLSAKTSTTTASIGCVVQVITYARSFTSEHACETWTDYGTNLANSSGTTIAVGTGWTQVVASTANEIRDAVLMLGADGASQAATSFDLAIGAAGSETIILSGLQGVQRVQCPTLNPYSLNVPFNIPKGTRIAARFTAGAANLFFSLLGGN